MTDQQSLPPTPPRRLYSSRILAASVFGTAVASTAITILVGRTWPQPSHGSASEPAIPLGIVCVAFLVLVVVLWLLPKRQAKEFQFAHVDRPLAENEFRKTLAQVLAGCLVLVTLWQFVQQMRLGWSAQLADRFTKAIEQLGKGGDDSLSMRLGAVYALERIARDSPTQYGPVVVEVLSAFSRESLTESKKREREEKLKPKYWGGFWPPEDAKAALTVLGRRPDTIATQPNLTGVYLDHADILQMDLHGVNLAFADLRNARLSLVDLRNANLYAANLSDAVVPKTNFDGANLAGADLTNVLVSDEQIALAVGDPQTKLNHANRPRTWGHPQ